MASVLARLNRIEADIAELRSDLRRVPTPHVHRHEDLEIALARLAGAAGFTVPDAAAP